ncbi:MAG: tyrosine-type recombinase/integrase, partial [Pseudomonadota bacterium]
RGAIDSPMSTPSSRTGQKLPLTLAQARQIRDLLAEQEHWLQLGLFLTAIDTMLRASDLLSLRVGDLFYSDSLKARFSVKLNQRKTAGGVDFAVQNSTSEILRCHIVQRNLMLSDRVFSRRPGGCALSDRQYRRWVKRWVSLLGLEPDRYSTHSLRRTKPSILYGNQETRDVESIRILLGHKSISSTSAYLGISTQKALELGLSVEI